MTRAEWILSGVLAGIVVVGSLWIGSLYGLVNLQNERIEELRTHVSKQRDLVEVLNLKVAALEVKFQICMDELRARQNR